MIIAREYVGRYQQLIGVDDKTITVKMDDGEYETTINRLLFSAICWAPIVAFPKLKLTKECLLKLDDHFSGQSHMTIINNLWFQWIKIYGNNTVDLKDDRELFFELAQQVKQDNFDVCVKYLGGYITGFDGTHLLQIADHPDIAGAKEKINQDPRTYKNACMVADKVFKTDPALATNPAVTAVAPKVLSMAQVNQCMISRGPGTEIDSTIFPTMITASYFDGIRDIVDSIKDSRSGSKALVFQSEPLKKSEYSNRVKQLACQVQRHIEYEDCGTTAYLTWEVMDNNVTTLLGMHYFDDGTVDQVLDTEDKIKSFVGKTIKLRTLFGCKPKKHRQNVCARCAGDMQFNYPHEVIYGQYIATAIGEVISQLMLSIKHVEAIDNIANVTLTDEKAKWLEPSSAQYGNAGLCINREVADKVTKIEFILKDEVDFNRLKSLEIYQIDSKAESRVLQLIIHTTTPIGDESMVVIRPTFDSKPSSMSVELLRYIIKHEKGNLTEAPVVLEAGRYTKHSQNSYRYVVDMEHFDQEWAILDLPPIHADMWLFHEEIDKFLGVESKETAQGDNIVYTECVSITQPGIPKVDIIRAIHDMITERVPVNISLILGLCNTLAAVSPINGNYFPPRAGEDFTFITIREAIKNRSLAAVVAWEEQNSIHTTASNYIDRPRPKHPMDNNILR